MEIPLTIKRAAEKVFAEKKYIYADTSEDGIVFRSRNHKHAGFYFRVRDIKVQNGKTVYYFSYKPGYLENNEPISNGVGPPDFERTLSRWVAFLEEHAKQSPVFDDVILENYYQDLEPKFIITDDDADSAPYSFETQGALVNLYDEIKLLVEGEAQNNPENKEEADQIIQEIESAKKTVSSSTKNESAKRLQMVLARVQRYSYYIAKLITEGVIVDQAIKLIGG